MQAFLNMHPFMVFRGTSFVARFSNQFAAAHTAADKDVRGHVSGPFGEMDLTECSLIAAKMDERHRNLGAS